MKVINLSNTCCHWGGKAASNLKGRKKEILVLFWKQSKASACFLSWSVSISNTTFVRRCWHRNAGCLSRNRRVQGFTFVYRPQGINLIFIVKSRSPHFRQSMQEEKVKLLLTSSDKLKQPLFVLVPYPFSFFFSIGEIN